MARRPSGDAVNVVLVFLVLAPLTAGYMAMAPTFKSLVVPAAYRGDYARLSLDLAPGFLAFCALYSMANPVFQLAKRTWPLTLAALAALALDLALVRTAFFGADIEGLARAQALSFVRLRRRRGFGGPRLGDPPLLEGHGDRRIASGLIAVAVHPLNALRPHFLRPRSAWRSAARSSPSPIRLRRRGLRPGLRRRLTSFNRGGGATGDRPRASRRRARMRARQ